MVPSLQKPSICVHKLVFMMMVAMVTITVIGCILKVPWGHCFTLMLYIKHKSD